MERSGAATTPNGLDSSTAAYGNGCYIRERDVTHIHFGGILLVLYASVLIDHFDLFGLRQVWRCLRNKEYTSLGFAAPALYRLVRHPLLLGWIIVFWSMPRMTQGHLLFAVTTTLYIFIAVPFEERDLLRDLGEDYRRYRARTRMMIPWPKKVGVVAPPSKV